MRRIILLLLVVLTGLAQVGVVLADDYIEGARLASRFTVYNSDDGFGVSGGEVGRPVIIVNARCYLAHSQVIAGVQVIDLATGMAVPDLEIIDWSGLAAAHPSRPADIIAPQFVLAGDLAADGRYQVRIPYADLDAFDDVSVDGGDPAWAPHGDPAPAILDVEVLPAGKMVDNFGRLVDDPDAGYTAPPSATGIDKLFDGGRFALTPEIPEDSDQLGASYDLTLQVDAMDLGWFGAAPGRFQLDLEAGGRVTTDAANLDLAGYNDGDLSARIMMLPGRTRYYPMGLRAAVGYEADEEFRRTYVTATGQLVVSVPYVERLALAWHRLLGVNRVFAPPFVSGAVVYAEAPDADTPAMSRFELEVGWIVPVAPRWDLGLAWQFFDFHDDDLDDESLFEGYLTYYVDDDRDQGLRVTLEDGFRPAVGDVGKTLLFGYLVEGF